MSRSLKSNLFIEQSDSSTKIDHSPQCESTPSNTDHYSCKAKKTFFWQPVKHLDQNTSENNITPSNTDKSNLHNQHRTRKSHQQVLLWSFCFVISAVFLTPCSPASVYSCQTPSVLFQDLRLINNMQNHLMSKKNVNTSRWFVARHFPTIASLPSRDLMAYQWRHLFALKSMLLSKVIRCWLRQPI